MGAGMIVVDANVVAYFFIDGKKTALARRVREHDAQWIVPEIWRHEFLNILVTSCLFAKLPQEQACRIWDEVEEMLGGNIYGPDMKEVLSAAVERSTTAYDAEYVVLAKAKGIQCVTEDTALQKAFPGTAVSMAAFLGTRGRQPGAREASGAYRSRRKPAVPTH
jgi:predicted nucleic acid-binding protein